MNKLHSRKGFTLIELLVVIGILAVLAAIAIPSVAGLIDRANVSADNTNANEYTNAMERFASEYELYCQDVASGAVQAGNLDSAQGRVYNVLGGATTRSEIAAIEVDAHQYVGEDDIAIYRDTKYPANTKTARLIVENYSKTSSSTFEPKQSDMHYWYSPDCGVVVTDVATATYQTLNVKVVSGKDVQGNPLSASTVWCDLTLDYSSGNPEFNVGDTNIVPADRDRYFNGDYVYIYSSSLNGWDVQIASHISRNKETYGPILQSVHGIPITSLSGTFQGCKSLTVAPKLPDTIITMCSAFKGCSSLVVPPNIPRDAEYMDFIFEDCTSLTKIPDFSHSSVTNIDYGFRGCTSLVNAPDFSKVDHYIDLTGLINKHQILRL